MPDTWWLRERGDNPRRRRWGGLFSKEEPPSKVGDDAQKLAQKNKMSGTTTMYGSAKTKKK